MKRYGKGWFSGMIVMKIPRPITHWCCTNHLQMCNDHIFNWLYRKPSETVHITPSHATHWYCRDHRIIHHRPPTDIVQITHWCCTDHPSILHRPPTDTVSLVLHKQPTYTVHTFHQYYTDQVLHSPPTKIDNVSHW